MSDSDNSRAASPVPQAGNGSADSRPGSEAPEAAPAGDDDVDMNDNDDNDSLASDLSEVDEREFEDFDPKNVALDEKPVELDEYAVGTLKASKRQRSDKDGKKSKEGKRDKKKRRRDEDEDPDGERMEGKRIRKPRPDGERKRGEGATREKRAPSPENEANLTPEERRRRALDKQMDMALKNPNKRRRRKDEVVGQEIFQYFTFANTIQDLEEAFDDEIAQLKVDMEKACALDNMARENNEPAIHKLKMLPQVVQLLNRNTVQHSIVDPDTNFLQSVKYFLEPLPDGSLPAYTIQRDLFAALARLPIEKEALLSSGIGKIVLFYTKSKKPEIGVKRTAERLLGDWSRPILKRSDDFKQRKVATREFDHQYVPPSIILLSVLTNHITGPLNSLSAPPEPKPHKPHRPNEQECPNEKSNENVSLPSQSSAPAQDWKPQIPVTLLRPRVPLILARGLIRCRDLLVLVVRRRLGR